MKYPLLFFALLLLLTASFAPAQVVGVTAQLDTNRIVVGQQTTLHIFAQVLPAYRAGADRIFSWYVDVLNTNGAAATGNYSALLKPASDKDPLTSSNGFTSGANRLAIYDTFLNLARAGVTNPVELIRIPIVGVAAGQTLFSLRHGTGQPGLSQDFLVASNGGSGFMTGGDYTAAQAALTVVGGATGPVTCLTLTQTNLGANQTRVTLTFCPLPGYNHFVDFQNQLGPTAAWQPASATPYNSGVYVETNTVGMRYYRIRATP